MVEEEKRNPTTMVDEDLVVGDNKTTVTVNDLTGVKTRMEPQGPLMYRKKNSTDNPPIYEATRTMSLPTKAEFNTSIQLKRLLVTSAQSKPFSVSGVSGGC